jgi:hypothetical protein
MIYTTTYHLTLSLARILFQLHHGNDTTRGRLRQPRAVSLAAELYTAQDIFGCNLMFDARGLLRLMPLRAGSPPLLVSDNVHVIFNAANINPTT